MTRGNQRDLARQRNLKKQAELKKGKREDNLTVEQRKQRDADMMREKQRKKEQMMAGGNAANNCNSAQKATKAR